jgi:hypothetical protein
MLTEGNFSRVIMSKSRKDFKSATKKLFRLNKRARKCSLCWETCYEHTCKKGKGHKGVCVCDCGALGRVSRSDK